MLDFITRMFVVVDVDHILGVVRVAIERLNRLIGIKAEANNHLEITRNKAADSITANLSEIARAENVLAQLDHIITAKIGIDKSL